VTFKSRTTCHSLHCLLRTSCASRRALYIAFISTRQRFWLREFHRFKLSYIILRASTSSILICLPHASSYNFFLFRLLQLTSSSTHKMRHFSTLPLTFHMAAHLPHLTLASSLHSPQSLLGDHDAQVADNTPFHPTFDSFVDSLMNGWHIPGLAIAVVHENKTWSKVTLPLVHHKHRHIFVARLW
jgi:hypothetical protein